MDMVEIIGSEHQLRCIMFGFLTRSPSTNHEFRYRKTRDAEGEDFHLILSPTGDEVAEWDDVLCDWVVVIPPRPTNDTQNSTVLLPILDRIEKQTEKMKKCQGKLSAFIPVP